MGLKICLQYWEEFVAETENGIVSENFCEIGIVLRIFLSEGKREEDMDLENSCPKKQKGERK